jgi:lysophospholipase L1-like esterase
MCFSSASIGVHLRTIFLVCLLAIAGCGGNYPKVGKLDANATLLAFGDSLTFGTGAGEADSYPAVLGQLIDRKVVRSGVPGEVSEEGLARLPEVLDEVQPGLLILCHGGNDFLRKMDDAKAAENVRAMVKMARDRGIAVVILATPKPGFGIAMPKFYSEIGQEFGIPVEVAVLESVLTDKSLKSDLVHPNAQGYRKIAEALAKVLKKSGAV